MKFRFFTQKEMQMQQDEEAFGGIPTLAYAKIFEQARKMRYSYYWTVEYGRAMGGL
jgi:hypothetical protein